MAIPCYLAYNYLIAQVNLITGYGESVAGNAPVFIERRRRRAERRRRSMNNRFDRRSALQTAPQARKRLAGTDCADRRDVSGHAVSLPVEFVYCGSPGIRVNPPRVRPTWRISKSSMSDDRAKAAGCSTSTTARLRSIAEATVQRSARPQPECNDHLGQSRSSKRRGHGAGFETAETGELSGDVAPDTRPETVFGQQ